MLYFLRRKRAHTLEGVQTLDANAASDALLIMSSRKNILQVLTNSLKHGTVVGVYATSLGEGMFLTAVEEIINEEGDKIIGLKRYDARGHILPRTHFALTEIQAVCPLNAAYVNPYLKR